MMHKNIPQNRQIRVQRAYFPEIRFERGAESLEGGGGIQLGNFEFDLLGYEFAFEI
jgi:hypothetical protein